MASFSGDLFAPARDISFDKGKLTSFSRSLLDRNTTIIANKNNTSHLSSSLPSFDVNSVSSTFRNSTGSTATSIDGKPLKFNITNNKGPFTNKDERRDRFSPSGDLFRKTNGLSNRGRAYAQVKEQKIAIERLRRRLRAAEAELFSISTLVSAVDPLSFRRLSHEERYQNAEHRGQEVQSRSSSLQSVHGKVESVLGQLADEIIRSNWDAKDHSYWAIEMEEENYILKEENRQLEEENAWLESKVEMLVEKYRHSKKVERENNRIIPILRERIVELKYETRKERSSTDEGLMNPLHIRTSEHRNMQDP